MSFAGLSQHTAHIAQLAEHALGKGEVIGSNPIVGSKAGQAAPMVGPWTKWLMV